MTANEVVIAVKTMLAPLSITIVGDNEKASGANHIRCYYIPQIPNILTMGESRIVEHRGNIQFDVFQPLNTTPIDIYPLIIDKITIGNHDTFEITNVYELQSSLKPIASGVYVQSVVVEYRFFRVIV